VGPTLILGVDLIRREADLIRREAAKKRRPRRRA
jgi:hypothetical protein